MEEINYRDAKIVVIDDKDFVLESIKEALEFEDMQVKTFQNPKEGLEYLKENKADVLLLDYYMPEMNGGELVDELRKFNNETIIILQTGFADDIPPLEMMDKLNIQGYVDKNEGSEKIILAAKSAIKTAFLNKEVSKQKQHLNAYEYRNEFLGRFLYLLSGEIKERGMIIGGLTNYIAGEYNNITQQEYKKYTDSVKQALDKLTETIKLLEIEKLSVITVKQLEYLLNQLLEIELKNKQANINLKYENEFIPIECAPKNIIYIMVEIIEYLLNQNIETISIIIEKEEETRIKICHDIEDEVLMNKILNLSMLDEKIKILKEFNQIVINM